MTAKLKELLAEQTVSVKDAMKKMDKNGEKVLFIVDGRGVLVGTLTDGDIRRWILKDGSLEAAVELLCNRHPVTVGVHDSDELVKHMMLQHRLEWLPVLDEGGKVVQIQIWDEIFKKAPEVKQLPRQTSVVVTAGGKGTRLEPFTKILPKALVPIEEKPVMEHILDRFARYGCKNFYTIVGYKAEMIQSYFEHADCPHDIAFIREAAPLGTAGGLALLPPTISDPFFLTNCDILIFADYLDLLEFHQKNKYDITLVGSLRHFEIPYGVLKIGEAGRLQDFLEKPEYDFVVNTGMYVINRSMLNLIPRDKPLDFNHFLDLARAQDKKIGVYPISEKSWFDIGNWDSYHGTVKDMQPLLGKDHAGK